MLPEALPVILIQSRKVMKHSSINWCLSLQHSVQFPMLRGCPKSGILYVIWELFVVWNWHGVDHKGLVDTARSSSSHHHTPNEGYETLNDQRVSLLAAHHPIYCAERVPNIRYFVWNLRLVFSTNDLLWTIRGSHMLSEGPIIIPIQLSKIMKQSSSNGCVSL